MLVDLLYHDLDRPLGRLWCLFSVSLYCSADHLVLHSFPTRRSSDLSPSSPGRTASSTSTPRTTSSVPSDLVRIAEPLALVLRSEEHTSELQSLRHLVCRLLLEKKTADCWTPCGSAH